MECIKCGRDTDQSFCTECREQMKKYPIKSGTVVLLPGKREDPRRVPKKKAPPTPEEQVVSLKKTLRRFRRVVAVLLVLLLLSAGACYFFYNRSRAPRPGQNYTAITKSSGETTGQGN